MIGLTHYLSVAAALFVIGIFGIFIPYAHGGCNKRLPDRVGPEFLQGGVGIDGLVVGVGVEQR